MAAPAFSVMAPEPATPFERSIRLRVLPLAWSVMLPVESSSRLEGATPVAPVIRAPAHQADGSGEYLYGARAYRHARRRPELECPTARSITDPGVRVIVVFTMHGSCAAGQRSAATVASTDELESRINRKANPVSIRMPDVLP